MSKKERLQARLDYLKALIIAFLVALFGIFGYTATHYKEIDLVLGVCIAIGIIVLLCGIYVANRAFNKRLDDLEEL